MMSKTERIPLIALVLFAAAAFLIGFGGINAVRAAPRVESADYRAQVVLSNIHVVLVEYNSEEEYKSENEDKGSVVEGDDTLLKKLLEESGDSEFKVGKKYYEKLTARNAPHTTQNKEGTGIDEYVRVSVYRYWTDENGKAVDLDPSLIDLHFVTDPTEDGEQWIIDEAASTPERTVLYYKNPKTKDVLAVDKETSPFVDSITINSSVATAMADGDYEYKGVRFNVKAVADAVQTHNGNEAMMSAWGKTNNPETWNKNQQPGTEE